LHSGARPENERKSTKNIAKRIFKFHYIWHQLNLTNMRLLLLLLLSGTSSFAQQLPSRWDELTASDWPKALEKSARTCILRSGKGMI